MARCLAIAVFLFCACGDKYFYEEALAEVGPGVGGEYFLNIHNVVDTCTAKTPHGLLFEVEKSAMFFLRVEPQRSDESLVDIIFCENDCVYPRDIWSNVAIDANGKFYFVQKGDFEQEVIRHGGFYDNRLEVWIINNTGFVYMQNGKPVKVDRCSVWYYGLGKKELDYPTPVNNKPQGGAQ